MSRDMQIPERILGLATIYWRYSEHAHGRSRPFKTLHLSRIGNGADAETCEADGTCAAVARQLPGSSF